MQTHNSDHKTHAYTGGRDFMALAEAHLVSGIRKFKRYNKQTLTYSYHYTVISWFIKLLPKHR
jgi:hypothetical protein